MQSKIKSFKDRILHCNGKKKRGRNYLFFLKDSNVVLIFQIMSIVDASLMIKCSLSSTY